MWESAQNINVQIKHDSSKHPHGHLSFQLWTLPVTLQWVPFQSPLCSKPRRLDLCGNAFLLSFSFTAFASLAVVGLWGHLYQWSQTECVLLCVAVSIRCYVLRLRFVTVLAHAHCRAVSVPQFTILWLPGLSRVCSYGYRGWPCCEYTAPSLSVVSLSVVSVAHRGPKLLKGKFQKWAVLEL